MIRKLLLSAALLAATGVAHATVIFSENFDNVATLAGAGWTQVNNSAPSGATGWFQGNAGIFDAQSGASDSYIAANFLNADFGGNISNWLVSPMLSLASNHFLTFYTRSGGFFADQLEVRLSVNGASGNVGATDSSVGDFSQLLLTVNPLLDLSYPTEWAAYTVQFADLAPGTIGRFAFRYSVPDTFTNADYIGIDSVRVFVPEPSTVALFAVALFALAGTLRRRHAR